MNKRPVILSLSKDQFSSAPNRHILAILILISAIAFISCSHKDPYNLSSVKLLEGYSLTQAMGDDSYTGRIWKKDGLHITFDFGVGAGLAADPSEKSKYKWFQQQIINGHPVYFALVGQDGDTHLFVTFSENDANFATKVSTQADVAEALAMILTYKPTN